MTVEYLKHSLTLDIFERKFLILIPLFYLQNKFELPISNHMEIIQHNSNLQKKLELQKIA